MVFAVKAERQIVRSEINLRWREEEEEEEEEEKEEEEEE